MKNIFYCQHKQKLLKRTNVWGTQKKHSQEAKEESILSGLSSAGDSCGSKKMNSQRFFRQVSNILHWLFTKTYLLCN